MVREQSLEHFQHDCDDHLHHRFQTKKMNFPNLIPQDTRAAEILSGVALILHGLATIVSSLFYGPPAHQNFWVLVSIIFGAIQIVAILRHPDIELTRVMMAWLAGSGWFYMAALNAGSSLSEAAIMMALGVSNMVAFIVNLAILRILWKP